MVARPGRHQATFSSGEIDPQLYARPEQKAYQGGLKRASNIEIVPQGGFRLRPGLRHVGEVASSALRLVPFQASDGASYDLVFSTGLVAVWNATAELDTVATPWSTTAKLRDLEFAQQLDTLLVFHVDHQTRRIRIFAPDDWTIGAVPYAGIPTWDYGDTYTNGVVEQWEMKFIGTNGDTVFNVTVNGAETEGIDVFAGLDSSPSAMTAQALRIRNAIRDLPNVSAAGITVTAGSPDGKPIFTIEFGGENTGPGWYVSGRVQNKADAAIMCYKVQAGIEPGEDIMSTARGWPRCGFFRDQRLIIGGLKSLPNAWLASIVGDYFNFDERLDEASGAFVVPMDTPGGEKILRFFAGRNMLIFTSRGEYWISNTAIKKTEPPTHVLGSSHGSAVGIAAIENEGGCLFVHAAGGAVGEFMYSDVTGNYVSTDVTLVASHLMKDGATPEAPTKIVDTAIQKATTRGDGNRLGIVLENGEARLGTLLREQEITAFGRIGSNGLFKAVAVNGRNEMSVLVERSKTGGATRRLERFEPGLILDGAIGVTLGPPSAVVTGLAVHNGASVWAIADGDVFGPFIVAGGTITLPRVATAVTVGRWTAPDIETLPLSKLVAQGIWVERPVRIHSVQVLVADTTSIAIGANGGRLWDVDLRRFGQAADVAELAAGVSGWVGVRGLTGYTTEPTVRISQLRPGRLTVKAISIEATI